MKATNDRLSAEAAQRLAPANASSAERTTAAETRIAEARAQAMASVREIAVEAAQAMAETLTGGGVDRGRIEGAVEGAMRERAA